MMSTATVYYSIVLGCWYAWVQSDDLVKMVRNVNLRYTDTEWEDRWQKLICIIMIFGPLFVDSSHIILEYYPQILVAGSQQYVTYIVIKLLGKVLLLNKLFSNQLLWKTRLMQLDRLCRYPTISWTSNRL